MGELKNIVNEQQDVLVRVKDAGRQVAMAGLGLIEVLKSEGEKLQAIDFTAKTEELKAKALDVKAKLVAIDVKAEADKLQSVDVKAKTEELKAKAEELKVKAVELKDKLVSVDAKAELDKLLADVQKLFAELVAKGEKRAA